MLPLVDSFIKYPHLNLYKFYRFRGDYTHHNPPVKQNYLPSALTGRLDRIRKILPEDGDIMS